MDEETPKQMAWEVKVLQLQSPDGDSVEIKNLFPRTMVKGKKRWLDPINQATLNSSDFFRNCFVRRSALPLRLSKNLQKIKFTSK